MVDMGEKLCAYQICFLTKLIASEILPVLPKQPGLARTYFWCKKLGVDICFTKSIRPWETKLKHQKEKFCMFRIFEVWAE